jgi:hypothetical protein
MARPKKNNLEYFSHDKDMRNDLKIKALRRKYSHKGYSIYVMMLEHISNCDYLQYEWSELNIELLTPDFDIDATDLIEIIDYCVKLNLFQIHLGYIYSHRFYERNEKVLNSREGFSLNNSPIMMLKQKKLLDNVVNPELTIVNPELIHRVKESKVKESIGEESIEQNTKEQESKEDQIKRKYNIAEELKGIFKTVPDILKLVDRNDLDTIERREKYLFNLHYATILDYQKIKI